MSRNQSGANDGQHNIPIRMTSHVEGKKKFKARPLRKQKKTQPIRDQRLYNGPIRTKQSVVWFDLNKSFLSEFYNQV